MAQRGPQSGNPFVFDRPLEDAGSLIDRDHQLITLREALTTGRDAVVEGPAGHGKTSLTNSVLAELADGGGALTVQADCAGTLTVADLAQRLEAAYARAWAEGPIEQALVERLDALPFRLIPDAEAPTPESHLEALLDLAGDVAGDAGCRAVVCFDDFPDALAVPGIAEVMSPHRGDDRGRMSRVFTGSGLTTSAWRQDLPAVRVGLIEPMLFAGEITRRLAETGRDAGDAARAIAIVGGGHPQRTSLLAAQLWDLTGEGERATVADARTATEQAVLRCTPEFEVRWQSLHANERRVAVALARDIAPQGTRAQRATGLAGYGAAQRALQGLKAGGVARVDGERTALSDPLFAEWLRQRYERTPLEPGAAALRRLRTERGGARRSL